VEKLANLVHLNPSKDLQANWFLPACFGQELPKGSKIERLKAMSEANVNELIGKFDDIP
jgi:hypothetical protein